MDILAQATSGGSMVGPSAGIMGFFMMFWCFGITVGIGQIVLFITALVQILSRAGMPTEAKILWCIVSWIVPIIGPILWWTIGSKQHPVGVAGPPGPRGPAVG
jgi:cytochrome bd-type quinol oxidase subunit 1